MNSAIETHKRFLRHLLHHCQTTLLSPNHLFQIHTQLITAGHNTHQSLLFPLLDLFASNPSTVRHAALIFDRIHRPDVATWHVMIRRHASLSDPCQSLSFFRRMQKESGDNDCHHLDYPFICASVVKACGRLMAIREGKSVHCHALRLGLDYNLNVQNTLIHFYLNSVNSICSACSMFDKVTHRNIVTVNCMISGIIKNKLFNMGLSLFKQVLDGSIGAEGLRGNDVTLLILVAGCAEFGDLGVGKSLHAHCFKVATMGFLRSSVSNALTYLYVKFECMDDAAKVFEEMPLRDLVSWNTMIAGYGKNSDSDRAIAMFKEMRCQGLEGDELTLVTLISACAQIRDLDMGKWVHAHLKRRQMVITISIATALISMYSKCGLIKIAREVFEEMSDRNIMTFNSMILGYVDCGFYTEALSLFNTIQSENLKPDEVTMLGLISACRNFGVMDHGRQIHSSIERNGLDDRIVLCNALIDMYAKCGSMSRAKRVFDKMTDKDVISWTSMIVGYAINGEGVKGLVSFQQMCSANIEPNSVTFIGVLSACDHAGLVEDGWHLYGIMCKEYSIEPKIEHYGCMVDMLARAGLLEEAHEFVKGMRVEPNAVIWRMLIGACKIHGDVDLGASLVDRLLELKKFNDPEDYVISSNMFATAGKWDDALRARRLMLAQKILKTPVLALGDLTMTIAEATPPIYSSGVIFPSKETVVRCFEKRD
ncbi:pentatricopeptide repeat-containing protein At1g06140, mitochondrial isoform X3 [Magnolia sinica]|uniref:pentatricopeptide repeat-containing protein At1g06140, mitochondrial isoform X3 n=1 Tax=Magnolia sinica TaxID=86752 RepID=UPI00265A54AA|nr:pentatricopeptide repeat-containing protein At1g06140, mitochondrial isoform X3 [Magnolia sinica]XP_058096507.1 pentatricopeptide repeat-containing protein At1g06140, mitochondrial isoform X3 [Magnolia sinica]XP_058096508.1 pentatricopeptide repeat-containing protein At1g06140, mitochondrial isoform X3 [Magnolia sinica]